MPQRPPAHKQVFVFDRVRIVVDGPKANTSPSLSRITFNRRYSAQSEEWHPAATFTVGEVPSLVRTMEELTRYLANPVAYKSAIKAAAKAGSSGAHDAGSDPASSAEPESAEPSDPSHEPEIPEDCAPTQSDSTVGPEPSQNEIEEPPFDPTPAPSPHESATRTIAATRPGKQSEPSGRKKPKQPATVKPTRPPKPSKPVKVAKRVRASLKGRSR